VNLELSLWRDVIEQRLGIKVDMLAWPYGFHDTELENFAERNGYAAAFAVKDRNQELNRFALPRISIGDRDNAKVFQSRLLSARATLLSKLDRERAGLKA
jgi:hypothetical protein